MADLDDPVLLDAIRAAARAQRRATGRWSPPPGHEEARDAAALAERQAAMAIAHLEEGRWDEAAAAADDCLTLEEEHGHGAVWRDFALLVEEAAEVGRT